MAEIRFCDSCQRSIGREEPAHYCELWGKHYCVECWALRKHGPKLGQTAFLLYAMATFGWIWIIAGLLSLAGCVLADFHQEAGPPGWVGPVLVALGWMMIGLASLVENGRRRLYEVWCIRGLLERQSQGGSSDGGRTDAGSD